MKRKTQIISAGIVLLFIFLVAGGYFLYQRNCGFAREMKAYTGARSDVYFWGKSYCPGVSSFKKADQNIVKDLSKDKKSEIVTKKEDGELEKILTDSFLGYNKYTAGEGKNSFVVYETICKPCEAGR